MASSTINNSIQKQIESEIEAEVKNDFPVDPMHQFDIHPLYPMEFLGVDISFTNAALWMMIAVLTSSLFMMMGSLRARLVPGKIQMASEALYNFIAQMVKQNASDKAKAYFPFIFTLFIFILTANLLGMLPYSFTVTSHIIVTFAFAAIVFLGVTIIGFIHNGVHFLNLFVPKGIPKILLPLLIVIEIISYLTRPISLSFRLFANMMAGHILLKVFAGFVILLGAAGGFVPLAFMAVFSGLEVMIAMLQAYVFAVLTCIYLNDALNMSH